MIPHIQQIGNEVFDSAILRVKDKLFADLVTMQAEAKVNTTVESRLGIVSSMLAQSELTLKDIKESWYENQELYFFFASYLDIAEYCIKQFFSFIYYNRTWTEAFNSLQLLTLQSKLKSFIDAIEVITSAKEFNELTGYKDKHEFCLNKFAVQFTKFKQLSDVLSPTLNRGLWKDLVRNGQLHSFTSENAELIADFLFCKT